MAILALLLLLALNHFLRKVKPRKPYNKQDALFILSFFLANLAHYTKKDTLTPHVEKPSQEKIKPKNQKHPRQKMYRVKIRVKEVRGNCALGYRPEDNFTIKNFYIKNTSKPVCLHALASMLTLLAPPPQRHTSHSPRKRQTRRHRLHAVPRHRKTLHLGEEQ
jgi:uncharacterized repeat protein (TIGR04076 family)